MKICIRLLSFLFVLTAFIPAVYAQDSIVQNSNGGISQEQMNQAVNDYFKNYPYPVAGGYGAPVVGSIPGTEEETAEGGKAYRYDKKKGGPFYGVELPPRSFNNITYPY